MNKKQRNVILGTTAAGIIAIGGLSINSYLNYKENKELVEFNKNLIAQVQELENNKIEVVDVYYDQIQEKNNSELSLNIFESEFATFKATLQEDEKFNPIETTVRLKWKYKAELDIKNMEVIKQEKDILFNINPSLISISDVVVDTPQTISDTNFFNKFSGQRVEDINNKSIRAAYNSINVLAKNDFNQRYDNIVKNIEAKLSYLYGVEQKYIKVNLEVR